MNDFMSALITGDRVRVEAMLAAGHDPNTVDEAGATPLYCACVQGNAEITRLLLEYGADPNRPSGREANGANGASGAEGEGLPLCAAACWGHDETVQVLLDGGADPNLRESATETDGWTALLWAAGGGHLACVDLLLDAGADPNLSPTSGPTPLTLAAEFGAYGLGYSLLEHGADPALPGGDGATPLEIARKWLALDLEAMLREQVEGEDQVVVVTRSRAADGTELIQVEARHRGGAEAPASASARVPAGISDSTGVPPGDSASASARLSVGVSVGVSAQRGHAALATVLEDAVGVRTPVEQLVERALPYHDEADEGGDATWWAVVHVLRGRGDEETLAALTRLCESRDPLRRTFAVDVLGEFGFGADARPFLERTLPVLRRLALEESDPRVLEAVLAGLAHHADTRALPEVLAVVGRPGRRPTFHDAIALAAVLPPGEDEQAVEGDEEEGLSEGLSALIRLTEDADAEVRDWATMGLAGLPADTGRIREALVRRLADDDITTVAEAVRGLADRADHRAVDGIHRVLSETDDAYARDLVLCAAGELGLSLDGVSL